VRLSEDKIKAAILDADLEIRQRAIGYFAKSYSADLSVMPLVIQAVEQFGRQDAYHLIGLSRDLPQTEATIAWIIDELNNEESDQHENYIYNLSMVLVKADPALLLQRESAIVDSLHFLPELRKPVLERLEMHSWDEVECWQKLEDFCEAGKDKQYASDVNLGHANRIVEALARNGDKCEERTQALLRQTVDDFRQHPMKWMELLVVRLAGEAHLDSTVPLIIAKLVGDGGDLLNERCAEALTRIGTSAVLEAVAEAYTHAPRHFRLYATDPLENIHSDLAVEKCLHLLRLEKENLIRLNLAHALLSQFAPEGIEEARKLLVGRELDFESRGLRNYLVETCTIMGVRFPEYDEWQTAERTEKEEHWKRVKELEGNPAGLILFALEKLIGKKAADLTKVKPPVPRMPPRVVAPLAPPQRLGPMLMTKQKVGRNDACPCGSGKKFKNCCLRKQSE
jgi:SEC-C motif